MKVENLNQLIKHEKQ